MASSKLRPGRTSQGRGPRSMTLGVLMIFPSLGLLLGLFILPIVIAARDSFYRVNTISGERAWVGFSNFVWLFTSAEVHAAFVRSLVYSITTITAEVMIAILVANLLRTKFRGRGLARSLIIAPYVVPTIVVVLIWRYLLEPSLGVLNLVLGQIGVVDVSPAWLGDTRLAFPAAILVTVWKYTPFMVILFAARLQSVPPELYEAVSIDRGGAWARLRHVTIPWLAPVIGIAAATRGILSINEFDLLYLLTGGGPQGSTTTIPLIVRSEAFASLDSGRASSIAVSMALFLVCVLGLVYFALRRRA